MSIKRAVALSDVSCTLISATGGSEITTGIATQVSKDGGAYANTSNAAVHLANGLWVVDLTAGEMTADMVVVKFAGTGAITRTVHIKTETKITSDLNDIAATAIVTSGAIATSSGSVINVQSSSAATVSAINNNVITAAAINTGAITSAKFAGGAINATVAPNLNATVSSRATPSDVFAQCNASLVAANLDHLLLNDAAGGVADNSVIARLASKSATASWASFDNTADSLEAISDAGGGGLTQQQVRDAMKLAPTAGAPSVGSVDEHLDDVLVDTNELQTDWADGGRLDLILDSRMAEASIATTGGAVDNVTLVDTTTVNTDMRGTDGANTTAPLDAAGVRTAIGMAAADLDAQMNALAGFIDTEVAAILVVTNKLDDTLEDDAGTWRFTTNALEQAPAGGGGGGTATLGNQTTMIDMLTDIQGSGFDTLNDSLVVIRSTVGGVPASSFIVDSIETQHIPGRNLFVTIKREATGEFWNDTSQTFEASPALADRKIVLTESVDPIFPGFYTGAPAAPINLSSVGPIIVYLHDEDDANDAALSAQRIDSNGVSVSVSVDEDALASAVIAGLGSSTSITVSGPVLSASQIELVKKDDYKTTEGRELKFISNSWPDLTGATVSLRFRDNRTGALPIAPIAGTVVVATGDACVTFELTQSQTNALEDGKQRYVFDVQASLANGNEVTLVRGGVNVVDDVL